MPSKRSLSRTDIRLASRLPFGQCECHGAGTRAAHQSKDDKKRIQQLEKELQRKEKALAEAAALLILRKKAQAIWGDKEDD